MRLVHPPGMGETSDIGKFLVHAVRRNRWLRILFRTGREMTSMDTTMRCAGVAYFGMLSLFPAAASAVLLIGLLASPGFLADTVERLEGILPDLVLQTIAGQLASIIAQPRAGLGLGLAVSLVVALWSGSRGIAALMYATSRTQALPDKRSAIVGILVSIIVTLLGGVVLLAILGLVAVVPALLATLPFLSADQSTILMLRWPVLVVLGVVSIAAFYRFAPDRKSHRARWIWPGAIAATILWLAVCAVFSFYVENLGNFEASFGSLATAIVLLLWMYNSALIVVLGATLNAQLEREISSRAQAARLD
jgi:membrane protein